MPAGPPRRIVTRVVGLVSTLVLLSGCSGSWRRGGWPDPITEQGRRLLGVWQGFLIAAAFVGVFVIGLIVLSAIFHRRRSEELPRQVRYNLPIEVLYTILPIVMVAILFYFTAIRENDEDKVGGTPDLYVQVVGFQWAWQFNYVDDNLSVTGSPGHEPTLVLPAGETVQFQETSPDVIHSFWVIPFLFKRDVVPGHPNTFQVELNPNSEGTYSGKCTEFCGLDHDKMLFQLKVVSPADYQTWLQQAKTTANNGTNTMFTVYHGPDHLSWDIGSTQRSHT